MISYSVTSQPSVEPLTAAEAKTHLRVDTSDDDTYIATLIVAARKWVEEMGNLALITQTIAQKFDCFSANAGYIELAKSPVQSISSIAYVDENGDTQTWASANYQVDIVSEPARIMPVYGVSYPSTRVQLAPVTITYIAGFGAAGSNVPAPIIHAMKLLIADMYEARENQPRQGRPAMLYLLDNYRVKSF